MAKLNGAFLSFGAHGSIGKTLTVSKWRGIPYAKSYTVPSNPRTAAQQANRALFAYLREMWKLGPSKFQETWNAFAQGRPFTGFNKAVGENVRVLQAQVDLNNYIASPGSGGGSAPQSFNAVPGSNAGEIVATVVPPATPSGWTLVEAVAVAFPDADPTGIFTGPFVQGSDASAPYSITLTDLPPGELCQVRGWLKWQKPDLSFAYSVSLGDQAVADS